MIPIALQIKGHVLYFNPVMEAADELEKGKLVIFTVKNNAVMFHQLDEDFSNLKLSENKIQRAAIKQGHTGLVKVMDVNPERFIFDNGGKELMVFSLVGGSVRNVEFKPRKEILAHLEKEKKQCSSN